MTKKNKANTQHNMHVKLLMLSNYTVDVYRDVLIYTRCHKLGTTEFEMENFITWHFFLVKIYMSYT